MARHSISAETRAWVEEKVLGFVNDMYRQYRNQREAGFRSAKEPSITSTLLIEYVRQYAMPPDLDAMLSARDLRDTKYARGRDPQKLAIYGIIEGLRKRGKLGSSRGLSPDTGRDVRLYEPGE